MHLHQIVFVPPPPFVVAEASGFFQAAGLEVETTLTRSSSEQRDGLSAGDFDVAVTAIDNVIAWNARAPESGGDFRVVAQIERSTVLKLFGNASHTTTAALEGARILVDAVDSGFVIVLRNLLVAAGLAPSDVTLVPAGGVKERLDGVLAGRGDATLLGPPLDTAAEAAGLPLLAVVQHAYPLYPGQGVVVRRSRIDMLRPALTAYLSGLAQGLAAMQEQRTDSLALLVKGGFPLAAAQAVLDGRASSLVPSREGIELIVRLRAQLGLLPLGAQAPGYADMVDDRFLVAAT